MIWLIWIVALTAALILYYRREYSQLSDREVKHTKVIAPFGHMHSVLFRIQHFAYLIEQTYQSFPEERFCGFYEFKRPMIVLRDLELIKKVTIKDFEYFVDHRSFGKDAIDPFFQRNLFSLRGQEWKDMRSTLSPAFTSAKIRLMVPFMEEVGKQMMKALRKTVEESSTQCADIDVKDLTTRYANDVIASCAFGLQVGSHADRRNQFYEMGKDLSTFKFRQLIVFLLLAAIPSLSKFKKFSLFSDERKNFFVKLVLDTMKDRDVRKIMRPDMIQLLMEAKKGQLVHDEMESDESAKDTGFATVEESSIGKRTVNKVWSDIDLVAQAVLFFVAGFETISSSMSFALHEIALHPEVQDRLVQEIKEFDAKREGKMDYNSIQSMTYMDMVVSEVLRLWPPAIATDRCCVKNYNLGKPNDRAAQDYIVREGDVLQIPIYAIHRDPQYFPNPNNFDPDRFSKENKHLINPMAYFPFGIGPRNCIGSRFALCELKVLLCFILRELQLSASTKTRQPARLANDTVNLRLAGGHWVRFTTRT